MTTDQYLIDAATRRQVFLQRYGNGRSKEAVKILTRLRQRINARLSQEPENFVAQRLQDVVKDITTLSDLTFQEIKLLIEFDSKELAVSEASFAALMISKVVNTSLVMPESAVLARNVLTEAMSVSSGVSIADALSQFGNAKKAQILQQVIDGVTLGDSTQSIIRKVDNLIRNIMKRQITSLIGTIVNHVSSFSRSAFYKKNSRMIGEYEWVSTLDGRTTLVCMSRDLTVYLVGSGPMPPAHYGCRSTTVPVIRDEFKLGLNVKSFRPSVNQSGARQVDSKLNYGQWLQRQNKEFIDEALGIERSRLFRAGKLGIDKFVDPTGRVYTLSELESMNPIVFSDL
jgi:SPP1 gp7 family putative phage head morphogenesis protein